MKVRRFIRDTLLEHFISPRQLLSYLKFWARVVYRIRRPFIIGVTGSVGKSTTTAMLTHVLSSPDAQRIRGTVATTLNNMNDAMGLSATLLRYEKFDFPYAYWRRLALLCELPLRALRLLIGPYPRTMVLEYGTFENGYISRLISVAPPDVSAVTTIGPAHLDRLRTLEGVAAEKSTLVRATRPTGLVVLGLGHDYVLQLERAARAPTIKVSGKGIELARNITRALCQHIGLPDDIITHALREFNAPDGRLTKHCFSDMTVIDDTWNANPMSMTLGLDTLTEIAGVTQRRLAILGWMAELGDDEVRYHVDVGAYARTRADLVIAVGELSKQYDAHIWFHSSDACAAQIENVVRDGDVVLVKGSHVADMGKVTRRLIEIAEKRSAEPSHA